MVVVDRFPETKFRVANLSSFARDSLNWCGVETGLSVTISRSNKVVEPQLSTSTRIATTFITGTENHVQRESEAGGCVVRMVIKSYQSYSNPIPWD
ncbi:hypothetical protein AVEN_182950-1 [Araneus ventricosus]|uniref:Uncharacterized protein n=1 Tax=Araneus ventricosus TaxID=182803 RepID=A0A4Y2Q6E7_ARAVE|nr:hypothetical protein AVEN_182950-1 [Araneus ventricosus]